jgi:hypothetical protein
MITSAQAIVRGMRGESHSYLLDTKDGNHYVTKFAWGEKARRHAINEWIGSQLLSHLGLATPSTRIVEVTEEFLAANRSKLSEAGCEPSELRGLHFGSQYPGDPATSTVYDYLPDSLLPLVDNLEDFIGTLVFDLWCQKSTGRQVIFSRKGGGRRSFHALMIDNDCLFGGDTWSLDVAAASIRYFRPIVYANLASMADLAPWFNKIENIQESFFTHLAASVPREWVADDELALRTLLRRLSTRRGNLRAFAFKFLSSNSEFFPLWTARKGPHSEEFRLAVKQKRLA